MAGLVEGLGWEVTGTVIMGEGPFQSTYPQPSTFYPQGPARQSLTPI